VPSSVKDRKGLTLGNGGGKDSAVSDPKDQLRRQFDTVWRMASSGLDTLREVVVRSSQAGRLRVDLALLGRERSQLLAKIGEQVIALAEEDGLQVPEEVQQLIDQVRDIEARMRADSARVKDNAFGAPRGYEPEAGGFADDPEADALDADEHAEEAQPRKGDSR
jgi:hypothetical protein